MHTRLDRVPGAGWPGRLKMLGGPWELASVHLRSG